jgi:predicted kinase
MLIIFGGLPGTGKSTIAMQVAQQCGATYLRIDDIEQAIRSANGISGDVGPVGYTIAYALAGANLRLGRIVVADCVNPLGITRKSWQFTAASAGAPVLEVELVCSDLTEHRRRVESRTSDIPGLPLPSWSAVAARTYEPWTEPHLVVDTAQLSAADAVALICEALYRAKT